MKMTGTRLVCAIIGVFNSMQTLQSLFLHTHTRKKEAVRFFLFCGKRGGETQKKRCESKNKNPVFSPKTLTVSLLNLSYGLLPIADSFILKFSLWECVSSFSFLFLFPPLSHAHEGKTLTRLFLFGALPCPSFHRLLYPCASLTLSSLSSSSQNTLTLFLSPIGHVVNDVVLQQHTTHIYCACISAPCVTTTQLSVKTSSNGLMV